MAQSYDYLSYSIRIFAKKNTKFGVDKPTCLLVFRLCLDRTSPTSRWLNRAQSRTAPAANHRPDAKYRDV